MSKLKESFHSAVGRFRKGISSRLSKLGNAFKAAADEGRNDLGGKFLNVAGTTALGSAIIWSTGGLAFLPFGALSVAIGAITVAFSGSVKAAYQAYKNTPQGKTSRNADCKL